MRFLFISFGAEGALYVSFGAEDALYCISNFDLGLSNTVVVIN